MKQYGVGIVGCGNISDIYFTNITTLFDNLKLIGCCDLIEEKANAQAEKYDTSVFSLEGLLNHEAVDIILNITIPQAHKDVCEKALKAGKHVYVEKPLSLKSADGAYLVALAKEKNLFLGGAPDTFLGGGIQTCKKLIEDGWIGEIIGCNAFMLCHGHESWHPSPEFYYAKGGGPMYDMGPYYLTALAKLVGPVVSVAGLTTKGFDTRTITSEPKRGKVIDVEVPTHVTSLLKFENGAAGYMTTSFDVWASQTPRIEIFGTKGTLSVPDPNTFGGPILLRSSNDTEFKEIPLAFGYSENSRGLGISKMAEALNAIELDLADDIRIIHEASGDLTNHVLEVMEAIHVSSDKETFIKIESRF